MMLYSLLSAEGREGGVFVDPLVWIQSCLADLSNKHCERWAGCKCDTQTVSAVRPPPRYGTVVVLQVRTQL